MPEAVRIVPFGQNLLSVLARELIERYGDNPSDMAGATVLFPSRRAGIYLRHYLRKHSAANRPIPTPRIYAIEDLVNELAVRIDPRALIPPSDQAWWLWHVVREHGPFTKTAADFDGFFPWGIRLAGVIDKMERELAGPGRVYPAEGELSAQAIELLEHIDHIRTDFKKRLKKEGLTTPAERLRLLAAAANELTFPEGPLYLAGFFALTKAEEALFSSWLERGAHLFWEADPENLPGILKRQLKIFRTGIDPVQGEAKRPSIRFYEAPDLHHELSELASIYPSRVERPDEIAVLLCNDSALMPVVYSLPENMQVNITIGFPLKQTSLATLLEILMELQETRRKDRYHIPSYLKLLKHPFMKRLDSGSGKPARIFLHEAEEHLRKHGSPYLSLAGIAALGRRDQKVFMDALHEKLVSTWESIGCTRDLADVIRSIMEAVTSEIFTAGGARCSEAALEREFLYSLETELLPILETASFAKIPLRMRTLHAVLRQIVQSLRVPFEGYPLSGVQVMGLLESRLLCFKKVVVLEANEGNLPTGEEINPLIPEAAKQLLGLPRREHEEAIERYHFHRLIYSADEVHLFYQNTMTGKDRLLGKKVRSRFLEQLLWEEERKTGRLVEKNGSGNGTVKHIELGIRSRSLRRPDSVPKDEEITQAATEGLRKALPGISASRLNTYLACPVRYYFRYVLNLEPPRAIADFDPGELGTLVHKTLEEYFKPFHAEQYVPRRDNDNKRLSNIFLNHFRTLNRLGRERRFFIEKTAIFRLERYLLHLARGNTPFRILELEEAHGIAFGDYSLYGKFDRVEQRAGGIHILDYKTGSAVKTFTKPALGRLLDFEAPRIMDASGLRELQDILPDLQLLLYMYIYGTETAAEWTSLNAAYVHLATGSVNEMEKPLFRKRIEREIDIDELFNGSFPSILSFLLRHIEESEAFYATSDERRCGFCDFALACPCAKK